MITNLSLMNFKGVTASYEFAKENLIQGRNFSGKSAIDQAIRCLVLGYIPDVAKTAAALKMFASDYPMRIAMSHDGMPEQVVAFEKVKSTVKQTADVTLATHGVLDDATRVLFDPSIFFGLSDNARISKACELVQSQGGSPKEIADAIGEALSLNVEGAGTTVLPPHIQVYGRWASEVLAKAPTVNELLALSELFWKERKKEATAEKDRMQKMVEGMSDISTIEAELAKLPDRQEAEAHKAGILAKIQELTGAIATAESRATAAKQLTERIEKLQRRIKYAEIVARFAVLRLDTLQGTEAEIAKLQSELPEKRERLRSAAEQGTKFAHASGRMKYCKELIESMDTVRAEADSARADFITAEATLKEALEAHAAAEEAYNALKSEATQPPVNEDAPQIRTDDFSNAGPGRYEVTGVIEVNAQGEVQPIEITQWVEKTVSNPEADEAEQSRQYEAEMRLSDAAEKANETAIECRARQQDYFNAGGRAQKTSHALTLCQNAAAEMESLGAQSLTPPMTPLEMNALTAEVTADTAALKMAMARLIPERQALTTANAAEADGKQASVELAEVLAAPALPEFSPAELEALKKEHEIRSASYKTSEETVHSIIRFEQDRKRMEDAAARRKVQDGVIKTFGKVIDLIAQKKTEIVSGSIEAPLAIANKLAANILKGPLVFECGEIGMRVGDKFVSQRVFSGTETAIVMMGLTAGLAAKSNLRVLLLDEIGRLDASNAVQLIANLDGMVRSGDIDQFILIGPANPSLIDAIELAPELSVGRSDLKIIEV